MYYSYTLHSRPLFCKVKHVDWSVIVWRKKASNKRCHTIISIHFRKIKQPCCFYFNTWTRKTVHFFLVVTTNVRRWLNMKNKNLEHPPMKIFYHGPAVNMATCHW